MSTKRPPAAAPAADPDHGELRALEDELVREALAPYRSLPPAALAELELAVRDALACHPALRPLLKALAPPVVATSDVVERESGLGQEAEGAPAPPRRAGGGEP